MTPDKKPQSTYEKHYKEWVQNQEIFKEHPELSELFVELAKAKQLQSESKKRYDAARESIGNILKKCHKFKTFSLISGLQVTISVIKNKRAYKFNEKKFKAEHPNMYRMYLESTTYTSFGGQLIAMPINKSAMEDYQEFESGVEIAND